MKREVSNEMTRIARFSCVSYHSVLYHTSAQQILENKELSDVLVDHDNIHVIRAAILAVGS